MQDALSPYFDGNSDDFSRAVVRKTLRGEQFEGVDYQRLLINDKEDDSEVEDEEEGEKVVNAGEKDPIVECVKDNHNASTNNTIEADGENSSADVQNQCDVEEGSNSSETSTGKFAKENVICEREIHCLTALRNTWANTFKSPFLGPFSVNNNGATLRTPIGANSSWLSQYKIPIQNLSVSTLFSNFFHINQQNIEVVLPFPCSMQSEDDVD